MVIVKRSPRRRPSAAPTGDAATTYSASSQLRADLGPRIDGRYGSYQLLAKVGSGVFGDVYRAKDIRTGEIVAVKCLRRDEEEEEDDDDDPDGLQLDKLLEEEVRALEACRGNPHIVQVLDHGRRRRDAGGPEAFIVMEYVGPSLQSTILQRGRSTSARRYCEDDVRLLMRQLLSGAKRMHEIGLMHRDLKPDNVLVDDRGMLKICDLGFARYKNDEDGAPPFTNPVAALLYRAPEVLLQSTTYNELIDTWALGCIMAWLLAGKHLFRGSSEQILIAKILDVLGLDDIEGWSKYDGSMIPPPLQQYCPRRSRLRDMFPPPGLAGGNDLPKLSPAGFEVLRGLLTCNPERRMMASAALQHRWFRMSSTST
ncbi:hypothetical protein GUJ93_ZPchr0007g4870 [Zizania palustris]|uniref:[RNA-polymerase]-subunit kinase n=1 Tax=Zizania palustris TaxID=103762 RepID=A0A8J5VMH9_ZIZPA|nr:hypothetical protein GUJ93_ZPchr0007g4870 [Zizania palustris]